MLLSRKYLIYLIFILISVSSVAIIYTHKNKIDTDIFELLSLQNNQEEKLLIKQMQDSLSKEIIFISPSSKDILNLSILNQRFNIFEDIFYKIASPSLYFEYLNKLKIATLDRRKFDELLKNPYEFFSKSLQDLLSPFSFKPLGSSIDFFNLAGNSSLFSHHLKITPDFSTMLLKVDFEGQTYYFAKARLKQSYYPNDLLKFLSLAQKNNELLASGGAIYSAVGKNEGNLEGLIIGSLSFALVLIFVIWVFRSFKIFYFALVIVFSFLCGLAGSFVFLDRVHILSIVVCTSLAGLVLDFSMHWLGKNLARTILPQSTYAMKKVFLIVLIVTLGGYGIFLFSPMNFLHQIAIFSIFALTGAFSISYFLIPLLFENSNIKTSKSFRFCFLKFLSFLKFINIKILCTIGCIIIVWGIIFSAKMNFKDNVKNYSTIPSSLLKQSIKISKITGIGGNSSFILVDSNTPIYTQEKLIRELKRAELIKKPQSISQIFLNTDEQNLVKQAFFKASKDDRILELFKQAGLDKKNLQNLFSKIYNLPTLSLQEALNTPLTRDFKKLLLSPSKSIIVFEDIKNDTKLQNILEKYHSKLIDFIEIINENFTSIKLQAIILKAIAFVLTFLILIAIFGINKGSKMTAATLFVSLMSLSIFEIFKIDVNIFSVFGLILGSAVGIDYMIFAYNTKLLRTERIFGIILSALTSLISFGLLCISNTEAIFTFGLSSTLTMGGCALFASLLAYKSSSKSRP